MSHVDQLHVLHRSPMGVLKEVDLSLNEDGVYCIRDVIKELDIPVDQLPTICVVDGQPVKRAFWDEPFNIRADGGPSPITFITIPKGNLFKSILSLVATIALAVFAPWAAGIIASTLGITSTLGIQLIAAGIMLAGSFLISTFLAPTTNVQTTKDPAVASPTYSLTASGNQARLFQAIPKLYGRHMIYPDYAAQPYTEYSSNQQYLNQLFCCGLGEYDIEEMRIEETAFWKDEIYQDAYTGIEVEIVPPGEAVTLFHSQVVTSSEVAGNDMINWSISNTFTFNTADRKITSSGAASTAGKKFSLAGSGQKVRVNGGANAGLYTVNAIASDASWITVVEPLVSNGSVSTVVRSDPDTNWTGPYVANGADTITNKIQIDYVFPSGMFYQNDDGGLSNTSCTVESQAILINTAGIEIGSWFTLATTTYTRATLTPQRVTESYDVPDGRYKVRVRRTSVESNNTRYRSTVQWTALRAYIPNDNIYPDVTLVAIRMLATGQLTQNSSKKVNFIQTAMLPTWSPSGGWTDPVPTRSIAWAAADISSNATYGAGFSYDYTDLERLYELEQTWEDRGDTFNGVFDTTYSVWEALTTCLRTGRTIPVMIGGRLTYVRDEERTIPRGVFTPSAMVRNSFSTQHILFDDEAPDDVIIQFTDERTWAANEVQCTLEGSASDNPQRLSLFGITNRDQAWREGIFLAAVNAKRRIIANFTTEMEGRLLMRGDMVAVATDLYEWGVTGEVLGYDASTRTMYCSEPVTWGDDIDNKYMQLRKRNGEGWGPVKILPPDEEATDDTIIIDEADLLLVEVSQGPIENVFNLETDSVLTAYIVADAETQFRNFIITSGKPTDEHVDITCILEDPSVHEADLGVPPDETYPYGTGSGTGRPVMAFFSGSATPTSDPNYPEMVFAWDSDATVVDHYNVDISYDNTNWIRIYQGPDKTITYTAYAGPLFARAQGVNTQAGPWKLFSGVFGNNNQAPMAVDTVEAAYSISAGTLQVSWTNAVRGVAYKVEIYAESVVGSGNFDTLKLTSYVNDLTAYWTSQEVMTAGGPWPSIRIDVTASNSYGNSPIKSIQLAAIQLSGVTDLAQTGAYTRTTFTVGWTASAGTTNYTVVLYVDGMAKVTHNNITITSDTFTTTEMNAAGGPYRQVTVGVTPKSGAITGPETTTTVTDLTTIAATTASITPTYVNPNIHMGGTQSVDYGVDQVRIYHEVTNTVGTATLVGTVTVPRNTAFTFDYPAAAGSGAHYFWFAAYDSANNIEAAKVAAGNLTI